MPVASLAFSAGGPEACHGVSVLPPPHAGLGLGRSRVGPETANEPLYSSSANRGLDSIKNWQTIAREQI